MDPVNSGDSRASSRNRSSRSARVDLRQIQHARDAARPGLLEGFERRRRVTDQGPAIGREAPPHQAGETRLGGRHEGRQRAVRRSHAMQQDQPNLFRPARHTHPVARNAGVMALPQDPVQKAQGRVRQPGEGSPGAVEVQARDEAVEQSVFCQRRGGLQGVLGAGMGDRYPAAPGLAHLRHAGGAGFSARMHETPRRGVWRSSPGRETPAPARRGWRASTPPPRP